MPAAAPSTAVDPPRTEDDVVWEIVRDAVLILDREGRVVRANPRACELLGRPDAALLGCPLADFVELEDGQSPSLAAGAGTDGVLLCREAALRPVRVRGYPVEGRGKVIVLEDLRVPTLPDDVIIARVLEASERADAEKRRADELARAGDGLQAANDKLRRMQAELVEASRRAGMAEVASGILHNVGNILNSVVVTTALLKERIEDSPVRSLARAVELLDEQGRDLGDEQQREKLRNYLAELSRHLCREQRNYEKRVGALQRKLFHMRAVIRRQQTLARARPVRERASVNALIEEALAIHAPALRQHGVVVVRELGSIPEIEIDRHKLIQILVNLIANACDAMADNQGTRRVLSVRSREIEGGVQVDVQDRGKGIRRENLLSVFSYGFSTKRYGHGFGLHSSALLAREIGGTIRASSDGPGAGATFVLKISAREEAS